MHPWENGGHDGGGGNRGARATLLQCSPPPYPSVFFRRPSPACLHKEMGAKKEEEKRGREEERQTGPGGLGVRGVGGWRYDGRRVSVLFLFALYRPCSSLAAAILKSFLGTFLYRLGARHRSICKYQAHTRSSLVTHAPASSVYKPSIHPHRLRRGIFVVGLKTTIRQYRFTSTPYGVPQQRGTKHRWLGIWTWV